MSVDFWTFDLVEERLIEAIGFQRRMPGGGGSPFATDGPWSQIVRDRTVDYVDMDELAERAARPRSLRTAEVDRMNEALDWVLLLKRNGDARIVGHAIMEMERGGPQIVWREIAKRARVHTRTGRLLGPDATRMRYSRAIGQIAKTLNSLKLGGGTVSSPGIFTT